MVRAQIGYLNAEWKGRDERPKIVSGAARRANTSARDVQIHDARPLQADGSLDLDGMGFVLAHHRSAVTDFRDPDQIERIYIPEMSALLRTLTGADEIFAHAFAPLRSESPEKFLNAYSLYVHCDYADRLAGRITRKLLEAHGSPLADAAEGWEFAWYNLWRPIEREVQRDPLTLIDASTLDPADIVEYHPAEGEDGIASLPVFNEKQRAYYFPRMQTDEVAVFKQLDTRRDRAQVCPHTSFQDPDSPPDALARRSIELRLMCAFAP